MQSRRIYFLQTKNKGKVLIILLSAPRPPINPETVDPDFPLPSPPREKNPFLPSFHFPFWGGWWWRGGTSSSTSGVSPFPKGASNRKSEDAAQEKEKGRKPEHSWGNQGVNFLIFNLNCHLDSKCVHASNFHPSMFHCLSLAWSGYCLNYVCRAPMGANCMCVCAEGTLPARSNPPMEGRRRWADHFFHFPPDRSPQRRRRQSWLRLPK